MQDGTVALAPLRVDFSVQVVGTRSASQKTTLTNVGKSALNIKAIKMEGNDPQDFGRHTDCPASLPPKAHCTIRVTFKPTVLGPRTATVKIFDDAPGSPQGQ